MIHLHQQLNNNDSSLTANFNYFLSWGESLAWPFVSPVYVYIDNKCTRWKGVALPFLHYEQTHSHCPITCIRLSFTGAKCAHLLVVSTSNQLPFGHWKHVISQLNHTSLWLNSQRLVFVTTSDVKSLSSGTKYINGSLTCKQCQDQHH